MSIINDLLKNSAQAGKERLSDYKFPNGMGVLMDRYRDLKIRKFGQRFEERDLDDMSRPINVGKE